MAKKKSTSGRQAKKGGERGVNGEWYIAGQFLPSSAFTQKGRYSTQKISGARRSLISPGVYGVIPKGARGIYSRIQEFVKPVVEGEFSQLERNQHGDEVIKNFGFTPETLQEAIDSYNKGERYTEIQTKKGFYEESNL